MAQLRQEEVAKNAFINGWLTSCHSISLDLHPVIFKILVAPNANSQFGGGNVGQITIIPSSKSLPSGQCLEDVAPVPSVTPLHCSRPGDQATGQCIH